MRVKRKEGELGSLFSSICGGLAILMRVCLMALWVFGPVMRMMDGCLENLESLGSQAVLRLEFLE